MTNCYKKIPRWPTTTMTKNGQWPRRTTTTHYHTEKSNDVWQRPTTTQKSLVKIHYYPLPPTKIKKHSLPLYINLQTSSTTSIQSENPHWDSALHTMTQTASITSQYYPLSLRKVTKPPTSTQNFFANNRNRPEKNFPITHNQLQESLITYKDLFPLIKIPEQPFTIQK